MGFVFNPPLGEQVRISPAGQPNQKSLLVYFSTALDSDGCDGDVKVQIWSDLPAPGRPSGEWGETAFQLAEGFTLNTLEVTSDFHESSNITTLHAKFILPLSGRTRYSYTYRLVYPSGTVTWLGNYGQNGQLVLDPSPLGHAPLSLARGWKLQRNESYIWQANTSGKHQTKVGELDKNTNSSICAFGKDGFVFSFVLFVCLILFKCLYHGFNG